MRVTFLIEAEVDEIRAAGSYRVNIKSSEDAYFDAYGPNILAITPTSPPDDPPEYQHPDE